MAIIFELYAECKDIDSTQKFASHFNGLNHTLLSGRTISWKAEVTQPPLYPVAVRLWAADLSRSGVRTLQDALESTEAGLRLYFHLKTAPEFCYARVGWEVEHIPMAELQDYIEIEENGRKFLGLGCVIDDELYEQLGSPHNYFSFRDGYRWNGYRGESYQPLYSNDQQELNELWRKLLPE